RSGAVDHASIAQLTAFYRRSGASAITILGIMGEAAKLSDREREAVTDAYIAAAGPDFPVVVGVSAASTRVAAERARSAQNAGAAAVMVAPPPQVRHPGLLQAHFAGVAEAVGIPLVLQDEPVSTGVQMPAPLIADLAAKIAAIRYVKVEEPPTPTKIRHILAAAPKLSVFGGLGGLYFYEELARGAAGVMTGFAFPEILVEVCKRYWAQDREGARGQFYRYLPLIRFEAQLGAEGIGIRKVLYARRDLIAHRTVRAPAPPVDPATLEDLESLLQALGLA
nr:dihydrodipicolinate synthase family protein [Thermaerobacter sp.]